MSDYFNRNFMRFNVMRHRSEEPWGLEPCDSYVLINLDHIDSISKDLGGSNNFIVNIGHSHFIISESEYQRLCEQL